MPRFRNLIAGVASLLLLALGTRAHARIDTVAASVPPPPGELVLNFPDDIPPAFDRVSLHFVGSVDSNGYSAHTRFTWRFDWLLPSGELAYGIPLTYGLDPGVTTVVDAFTAADGCPTEVSLDFTTESPLGANVNGAFTHTCTIPEPGSGSLLALGGGCCLLAAKRSRLAPSEVVPPDSI